MFGLFQSHPVRSDQTRQQMLSLREMVVNTHQVEDVAWVQKIVLGFCYGAALNSLVLENGGKPLRSNAAAEAFADCGSILTNLRPDLFVSLTTVILNNKNREFLKGNDLGSDWVCFMNGIAKRGVPMVEEIIEEAKSANFPCASDDDYERAASYLIHKGLIGPAVEVSEQMRGRRLTA